MTAQPPRAWGQRPAQAASGGVCWGPPAGGEVQVAVERFRLPLARASGEAGSLSGPSLGSSADYHDHRSYQLGDDPRRVDWAAYARSEQLSLKLFREEVSPRALLILDGSASMRLTSAKAARSLQLAQFVALSLAAMGGQLRAELRSGPTRLPLPLPAIEAGQLPAVDPGGELSFGLDSPVGLAVVVSDLLAPIAPGRLLGPLAERAEQLVVFCPFAPEEAQPPAPGQLRFVDVESGQARVEAIDEGRRSDYLQAYRAHFSAYADYALSAGLRLARVSAEGRLDEALAAAAGPNGAVTPW